jgi:hypothetical protein
MTTSFMSSSRPLFGLIDGSAHFPKIYEVLKSSGAPFESVFAGLPENALGPAALFLVEIDDVNADWVAQLDGFDQQLPCLSLIRSRVGLGDMAVHLRAFLIADIGDGMSAMIRYYDPRSIDAMLKAWGEEVQRIFMSPIETWLYRGRHANWQSVSNDVLDKPLICQSIRLQFDQAELNELAAHNEPDIVLHAMIELEQVDPSQPYLARFMDFYPRYQRALAWRLEQPTCRLNFCRDTYVYGREFDAYSPVKQALTARAASGETYLAVMERLPSYVQDELKRAAANSQGETQ